MGQVLGGLEDILESIMDSEYAMCQSLNVILSPVGPIDCSDLLYEHCDVRPGNIAGTTCTVTEPDTCTSFIPAHYGISHLDVTGSKCLFVDGAAPCGSDSCLPVNGYDGLCSFVMTQNGEGCNFSDYIPAVTSHNDSDVCQWSSIFPWYLEV